MTFHCITNNGCTANMVIFFTKHSHYSRQGKPHYKQLLNTLQNASPVKFSGNRTLFTGRIQFKVLTTLPLKFKGLSEIFKFPTVFRIMVEWVGI